MIFAPIRGGHLTAFAIICAAILAHRITPGISHIFIAQLGNMSAAFAIATLIRLGLMDRHLPTFLHGSFLCQTFASVA